MKLTKSELHIVKKARRSLRWRIAPVCILGISSVAFLGMGTIVFIMLLSYLHQHGIPISNLMWVLSELQHPSGIRLHLVFTLAIMIPMILLVGLQGVSGLITILLRIKEQRLLLKLLDEKEEFWGSAGVQQPFITDEKGRDFPQNSGKNGVGREKGISPIIDPLPDQRELIPDKNSPPNKQP